MTHPLLLALLLALDVWDLPLVVHRCYTVGALLLFPWSRNRRPSSDAHCCNRWIVTTVDKSTALIFALLSLTQALNVVVEKALLLGSHIFRHRTIKWTLSFYGSTKKSLTTQIEIANIILYLNNTWYKNFHSPHRHYENNNIYICWTHTLPKIWTLNSFHFHSRKLKKNTYFRHPPLPTTRPKFRSRTKPTHGCRLAGLHASRAYGPPIC